MRTATRLAWVLGLGAVVFVAACASDSEEEDGGGGSAATAGTGGTGGTGGGGTGGGGTGGGGTGGSTGGTGGQTGGTGGGGTGGATGGTGGATGGTGGATGGTGGATGGTGGGGTGGATGGTGGGGTGGTGGTPCNATIADLRTEATGATDKAVDLEVCDAVVTYVYNAGYFIQDNTATGPGIQVYEGGGWTADVAVGDVVTLRVTEVSEFNGTQEVTAHDAVSVTSSGTSIDPLIQDLTVAPTEDVESELVRITNATLVTLTGNDGTIDYGTATGVVLRAGSAAGLCEGATFDILAPVTEFEGAHRIQAFAETDFTNIDTTNCTTGTGRTPAAGELVINEFMSDPPENLAGDANCDGTRDSTDDEFVEIVNLTGDVLALDGMTISDSSQVRYTFPMATDLPANGVVVVYGGGTASCTLPSNVMVMIVPNNSGLSLNNTGDSIILRLSDDTEIASLAYTGSNDDNASQTLSPDLDDTDATTVVAGFVFHNTVGTTPYSVGTKIDGTQF